MTKDWTPGICQSWCAEGILSCCYAAWCPCCVFGQNHAKFHGDTAVPQEPCSMVCTSWCFIDCLVVSFTGFYCVLPCLLRGDIRRQFEIDGTACCDCGCGPPCDDFCTELCCAWGCSLLQTKMTLKAMTE